MKKVLLLGVLMMIVLTGREVKAENQSAVISEKGRLSSVQLTNGRGAAERKIAKSHRRLRRHLRHQKKHHRKHHRRHHKARILIQVK